MPPPPSAAKPVETLTLVDLAAFPIWEYGDEEFDPDHDETWVIPVDVRAVPKRSYTIVAAEFRTACGRDYAGCIAVSRLEDPAEFFNGVIHAEDRNYLIPDLGMAFFDRAMSELLNGLGLLAAELFPIAFTLRVPFEGEHDFRAGVLDGRKSDGAGLGRHNPGQMTFW